jgi:FkbM family methyltransferase
MKIVQIGACRGNDDLTPIISSNEIEKLIIVEPMCVHNEALELCYASIKNKTIENVAISCTNDAHIDFYYHPDDGPGYEVSSTDINHIIKHRHLQPDRIIKLRVPSIGINDLLKKHGMNELDILFIDAEGLDDQLIRSIDFSVFKIHNIFYENLHLKSDVNRYLRDLGYVVYENIGSNGWMNLAVMNPDQINSLS